MRFAKAQIAERAVERIGEVVVRRGGEQGAGGLRPMLGGGDGERLLVLEMVEERALGDAGVGA